MDDLIKINLKVCSSVREPRASKFSQSLCDNSSRVRFGPTVETRALRSVVPRTSSSLSERRLGKTLRKVGKSSGLGTPAQKFV